MPCRLSCTLISRAILDLRSKFGDTRRIQTSAVLYYEYGGADEQTEQSSNGGSVPSFVRSIFGTSSPSVNPSVQSGISHR
jgi:hypothetical protein